MAIFIDLSPIWDRFLEDLDEILGGFFNDFSQFS